jgi:phosphoribosylaminoimidazole-succinocarboxamide synthase
MAALLTTNLGDVPCWGAARCATCMRWTARCCWWRPTASRPSITCWARDSGQRQDPDADFAVLVRSAEGCVPNHLITANVEEYPQALRPYNDQLQGRSMLVKRAEMFPVECVARGYLAGSGWKEYRASGTVCGIELPAGWKMARGCRSRSLRRRPKARTARTTRTFHLRDGKLVGAAEAAELRRLTLAIYQGRAHAEACGLILADTKFEFGKTAEGVILADEV